MKKKLLLLLIAAALTITPILAFAQTGLEIDYPETSQGETPIAAGPTAFSQYIKYIYNISFGISGIIAFLAILYAGMLYLTSAGDPSKIREAKDRIFSAFLGVFILLISYILLVIINPGLTMLILPDLGNLGITSLEEELADDSKSGTLGTVKEIGAMGKLIAEGIEDAASYIASSSLTCNCIFARSLCLCTGGEEGDTCEPQTCYTGSDGGGHPCDNYKQIKEREGLIMLWLDELIYYQNRAVGTDFLQNNVVDNIFQEININNITNILSPLNLLGIGGEAERLQKDLDKTLSPTLDYYNKFILTQTDQRIIDILLEKQARITREAELVAGLRNKLIAFAILVDQLKDSVQNISELMDECALNVQDQCKPFCIYQMGGGVAGTACHDTYLGCQSTCIGLDPCPVFDVWFNYGFIDLLQGQIVDIAEDITEDVDKIRDIKAQGI